MISQTTRPLIIVASLCLLLSQTALAAPSQHDQLKGPFTTVAQVSRQCLSCHAREGEELLHSSHWTWKRQRLLNGQKEVSYSKNNGLSTFALAAGANPSKCLSCHISSNLLDQDFDPTSAENIDCLVCHDTSGNYSREQGRPAPGLDLAAIARQVGIPTAANCLSCHGPAGDSGGSKLHPGIEADVHLQPDGAGLSCQDCHPTQGKHSFVRLLSSPPGLQQQSGCAACHSSSPHAQQQLNRHTETISCSSCHIPWYGSDQAALVGWNWLLRSAQPLYQQQGKSRTALMSANGIFRARMIQPSYLWDSGMDTIYRRGDKIEQAGTTVLQGPAPRTARSTIAPFSAVFATQSMDRKYRYLISPLLSPESSLTLLSANRQEAAREGMRKLRLPFSGEIAYTSTVSFHRLNHGVRPAAEALDCMDCHGKTSRLDWPALGYEMDPWQDLPRPGRATQAPGQSDPGDAPQLKIAPIREIILPEEGSEQP
ncbi:multiheme c-type cytochrome [Desulfogranum mediterraneum]|uniref:multiheme c-type cytochrome n=1 Tax=Desulfogranum mediterraneum TaxID=160661 RepID=UPI00040F8D50|nr:multiheme c-type cytochrome [Desulfogranum mediterraneum]